MDLYLIRHGDNPAPAPGNIDPDLTEKGIEQARKLGERLKILAPERVYASTLTRAIQTARVACQDLLIPIEPRSELVEINFGRLREVTWEQYEQENPGYYAEWTRHETDLPYPGGESGADVARRVLPFIEELKASGLRRVAVVTHGGVIRTLLCAFLGLGQEKRFLFGAPLENTSITIVRWDAEEGKWYIHSLNDASHLR